MARTYELGLVLDPRVSDEEAAGLVEAAKELLSSGGATIDREESWGKRRLAYPIQKLNEGRYFFLYFSLDGDNPIPEVEHRLVQNDKVLRFLFVRTDEDLKRAARKGKKEAVTTGPPEERDSGGRR